MPQIRPITDLRNTTEISDIRHAKREPVFITKNGYGDLVIMSMEAYEDLIDTASIDAAIGKAGASEYARTHESHDAPRRSGFPAEEALWINTKFGSKCAPGKMSREKLQKALASSLKSAILLGNSVDEDRIRVIPFPERRRAKAESPAVGIRRRPLLSRA